MLLAVLRALIIATVLFDAESYTCENASLLRARRRHHLSRAGLSRPAQNDTCHGGVCVGMAGGPHEGGCASYPVGNETVGYLSLNATMTVPELPEALDGLTYYIWSDLFFDDASFGRMNQLVPQLILGSALDSSSGPPEYNPMWHDHETWAFGAHYFWEAYDEGRAFAAYGDMYPTEPGEKLWTSFSQVPGGSSGPAWELKMGVVADPSRTSTLLVPQPYMGIGQNWPEPTSSWAEPTYDHVYMNGCWELYGAIDRAHFPSSGAEYTLEMRQGARPWFDWSHEWHQDEGRGTSCADGTLIREEHTATTQHVHWTIPNPNPGTGSD